MRELKDLQLNCLHSFLTHRYFGKKVSRYYDNKKRDESFLYYYYLCALHQLVLSPSNILQSSDGLSDEGRRSRWKKLNRGHFNSINVQFLLLLLLLSFGGKKLDLKWYSSSAWQCDLPNKWKKCSRVKHCWLDWQVVYIFSLWLSNVNCNIMQITHVYLSKFDNNVCNNHNNK